MSYLKQFIFEQMIKYRTIFETPVQVVSHLFFMNGGGQCMSGNNFCETVSFSRLVPFHQYYAQTLSLEDNKQYYLEHCAEAELDGEFKRQKDMLKLLSEIHSGRKTSNEKIWQDLWSKLNEKLKAIKDFSTENLFDSEWWLAQIYVVQANYHREYGDHMPQGWTLHLSEGYIPTAKSRYDERGGLKQDRSDPEMYCMYVAVVHAWIAYYTQTLEKNEAWLDKSEHPDSPKHTVRMTYERDWELLRSLHV